MDINADLHTDLWEMFLGNSHGNSRQRPILDTHTHIHIGIKSYQPQKKKSIQKWMQQEREKRTNNPNNQPKSQKMIDKMASVSSYLLILSKWLKFSDQNEEWWMDKRLTKESFGSYNRYHRF